MKRKPKKVSYELIAPDSEIGGPIYARMERLVEQHHEEISGARIALAWNTSWKPDVDGRCTLGMCKKAGDLDRELAAYDFIIILRRDFWNAPSVLDAQRDALLDHELQHATVAYDQDGEPKVDERGRTVYRIRRHDIEEFGAVVARHGLWKRDLVWFVAQVPPDSQAALPLAIDGQDDNATTDAPAPDKGATWWNH